MRYFIKHIKHAVICSLLLSACSHVSKLCDKDGVCLETWQQVSATNTVTISQLRTQLGTPVVGTTVTTTGGGVLSFVDPLAADINTTTTQAKTVQSW